MRKITNQELGRPSAEEFATMEKMAVTVVLDNVRSAQNVGAFFRTSDAFAVEKIVLCGITATPPSREIHKSSLGAEFTVAWEHYPSTTEAVAQLKEQGCRVCGCKLMTWGSGRIPSRLSADFQVRGG